MKRLGAYELADALTNQNAGYSLWAFGKKTGRDYFIKEFVEQKYPANDTVSSPERLQKKLQACRRFEQRRAALYQTLNACTDGNAVRVEEFFRVESRYYIAMQKIDSLHWGFKEVASLPQEEIRRLCGIIAHSIASLHKGGLIHADLKPANILFTRTRTGHATAKIIDFDSGFLETDPPGPGEDIVGDFHYFSPEACQSIWGEEVKLTCKMDIFALGVLFHQYLTGQLPGFDTEESSYSGEAAAKGEVLQVSSALPADLQTLLAHMLDSHPDRRPTAMQVYNALFRIPEPLSHREPLTPPQEPEPPAPEITPPPIAPSTTWKNPFFRPGDL